MNDTTHTRQLSAGAPRLTVPTIPTPNNLRAMIELAAAHFQPIVDLSTGEVIGAEALVRFIDSNGGVRTPSGLIERIEVVPTKQCWSCAGTQTRLHRELRNAAAHRSHRFIAR